MGYLKCVCFNMKFVFLLSIINAHDFSDLIKWHRDHGFLSRSVEVRTSPFGRGLFAKETIPQNETVFSVNPEWILSDENALKIIGTTREKTTEAKLCNCCILQIMLYLEGKVNYYYSLLLIGLKDSVHEIKNKIYIQKFPYFFKLSSDSNTNYF